ncbi:MAG TPA: GAP family protein [Solirubrobacteraceae bacterium]|jgi:hypothetical protein|nr:GAP family protein [Solirubrobacteraceae bacterium]
MTIEIVLLGLASALRPSSLVAVYALVRERSPARLLAAYVIAGLAFVFAVGVAVVLVCSGIELQAGTHRTRGIAEIAAGILAIGLGVALLAGRTPRPRPATAPDASGRLERLRRHEFTTRSAAVAGAATHIPGILYLVALELIVSREPDVPSELIQVGGYDLLWFVPPILVLAVCVFDPGTAREGVHRFEQWVGARARTILVAMTLGVGVWLLVDGATIV